MRTVLLGLTLILFTTAFAAPAVQPKTLVGAVGAGDLAAVQTFLQAGADPNDLSQKVPPLVVAANHGDVEITQALLAAGANPSLAGQTGNAPLAEALGLHHDDIALLLANAGADPKAQDYLGVTVFNLAISLGAVDVVKALLAHGADANMQDKNGRTPLQAATDYVQGQMKLVWYYIFPGELRDSPLPDDPTTTRREKDFANYMAVRDATLAALQDTGDRMIEVLLLAGADPTVKDTQGRTPLFSAFSAQSAKLLCPKGKVDPNARDNEQETPLFTVLTGDAAAALIAEGADPTLTIPPNRTALDKARLDNSTANPTRISVALTLIANNPTLLKQWGNLLLINACKCGTTADIQNALALGIDPNVGNTGPNNTPLLLAVSEGTVAAVSALLTAKANVNAVNSNHETPFMIATRLKKTDVATLLAAHGGVGLGQRPPIVEAAFANDANTVETLVTGGADVNVASPTVGECALDGAAQNGNIDLVQYLLAKGADIHATTKDGRNLLFYASTPELVDLFVQQGLTLSTKGSSTPLLAALARGDAGAAEALITAGAYVNTADSTYTTPLAQAVDTAPDAVPALLAKGADPNAHPGKSLTPFALAIGKKVESAVKAMAAGTIKPDPNVRGIHGSTLLADTVLDHNTDDVALLLSLGANPNVPAFNTDPLLLSALKDNQAAIVSDLLNAGADPNAADANGNTPLLLIDFATQGDLVRLLLAKGANPNARTKNGDTPLKRAAASAGPDLMALMLAAADPNTPDPTSGETPLFTAAAQGNVDAVTVLLAHGAKANVANKWSDTPLHAAALDNNPHLPAVVAALVKAGADINAQDANGYTPTMVSAQNCGSYPQNLQAFITAGADLSLTDKDGDTALHLAVAKCRDLAVAVLITAHAPLDVRNKAGLTPLGLALKDGGNAAAIAANLKNAGATE